MITSADLASMQTTQALTLTETATISRKTSVSDSMGGYTDTWATASTATARVAPANSRDMAILGGRIVEGTVLKITLPAGTNVTQSDRIVIGARSFEVLAVSAHTVETARVCLCVER